MQANTTVFGDLSCHDNREGDLRSSAFGIINTRFDQNEFDRANSDLLFL